LRGFLFNEKMGQTTNIQNDLEIYKAEDVCERLLRMKRCTAEYLYKNDVDL